MFALVVYGQLILENAKIYNLEEETLEQIFSFMVDDFTKFAMQMHNKPSATQAQMEYCLKMVRKPHFDQERYDKVWKEVHSLKGEYEMNA